MNLQVLISTMHQKNFNLVEKMNLKTDTIIINQCDNNNIEEHLEGKNKIRNFSFAERGVGLSRNTALMRATADICLFADDDCYYVDDYEKIILDAFDETPDADIIFFNLLSENPDRQDVLINRKHKVKFFNCLRYGTCRMAVRREKIYQANIFFSLLFGGGAKYSCGEDTLFIVEAIKKGLTIYAYPKCIGTVAQQKSTWFNGYNEKFFIDKGVLFACISKSFAYLLCMQYLIRHQEVWKGNLSFFKACKWMFDGVRIVKNEW